MDLDTPPSPGELCSTSQPIPSQHPFALLNPPFYLFMFAFCLSLLLPLSSDPPPPLLTLFMSHVYSFMYMYSHAHQPPPLLSVFIMGCRLLVLSSRETLSSVCHSLGAPESRQICHFGKASVWEAGRRRHDQRWHLLARSPAAGSSHGNRHLAFLRSPASFDACTLDGVCVCVWRTEATSVVRGRGMWEREGITSLL